MEPEEYWRMVGESPDHLVMAHCSNYDSPDFDVYVFSTLAKAEEWVAGTGYECVVYTTRMVDHPEYGNELDA